MNGISKLLSTNGFIQVNKALIKKFGLHESILIGELCSEYNHWEADGKLEDDMFYSTRENIEDNTGLSEHFQRKALQTLQEQGIIETKRKGLPAVTYYRIDFDKLLMALTTSSSSRRQLEVDPVNLNNNITNKNKEKSKILSKDNITGFQFGNQKPKKDNLYTKCLAMIDNYTVDDDLRTALIDYLKMRLAIKDKPIYLGMWKGLLNKLDREFDASERVAVVRQSIERGYFSFFPVSKGYTKDYDVRKGKPWEEGVKSERYTEEELAEIEEFNRQQEAKGLRTHF